MLLLWSWDPARQAYNCTVKGENRVVLKNGKRYPTTCPFREIQQKLEFRQRLKGESKGAVLRLSTYRHGEATGAGSGLVFKPSWSKVVRPVRTRHQSTINCRPMATAICLRLLWVVLGFVKIGSHWATV